MKFRQTLFAIASLSLAVTLAPSASAADRFKPGLWEKTTTENGKDSVKTQCVIPEGKGSNGTEQEIRKDLETDAASAGCTIKDFALKGDTLSYTFACTDGSTTTSTSYHGDAYESVITAKSSTGTSTRHIKGRRIGDCPGTAAAPASSGAAKGTAPAAAAKGGSAVGDAKGSPLEASIDRALAAYNRQEAKAFYAEWTSAFSLPRLTDYYVDAMKTLGSYVSRTMIKDDSVLDSPTPLFVYQARFSKAPKVKITVHFTKDGAATKILNIELDKM